MLDADEHIRSLHEAQQEALSRSFVSRKITRASLLKRVRATAHGLFVVSGKSGCGKSALVVKIKVKVKKL